MRNNLNKVVPKTETKVTISHTTETNNLCLNTNYFSQVEPYYSDKKPNSYFGVLKLHSLSSLLEQLHTSYATAKDKAPAILKGIYKGGTKGQHCTKGAPFLFFDIDVKEKENKHLYDAKSNADVFEALKEIAVLVWRSNSKLGIAGVLYVPQLKDYLSTKSVEHLKIGKSITNYLQKELGIRATLDDAQSKFRQIRFLASQDEKRELNPKPYRFCFELKEIEVLNKITGVKQFAYSNGRASLGSIQNQFNNNVNIQKALLDNGFQRVSDSRYLHPRTTSKTTGEVRGNVFLNNSTSFSNYQVFTPFWLYYTQGGYSSIDAFEKELRSKGYQVKTPSIEVLKSGKAALEENKNSRYEAIFKACYDLVNLPYKQKVSFAKENAGDAKELIIFNDYLKIKPLTISYDETLKIKNYVSEQIQAVLNYVDTKKRVILTAETGTGKTSAILRNFKEYRPHARLLILAPLTIIVDQIKASYPDIIALTGSSEPQEHSKAKTASLVVSTYEQGTKHLRDGNKFDYIVIDEVHNLLSGHSYKSKQIKELTNCLFKQKVIGLTGTSNTLFKKTGYKLINIQKEVQKKVSVNMRSDNRDSAKIILQHISKIEQKAIFRLNNTESLKEIKKDLVKNSNYTDDQILILQSTKGVKMSQDFNTLSSESKFRDDIKIVLTTGLIDEGLSIKQEGFKDVVFIETEYNPTPEAMKQFFARFRNEEADRKNYYYFKKKRTQKQNSWNPFFDFDNRLSDLKDYKYDNNNESIELTNTLTNDALFYPNGMIDLFCLANEVNNTFFKLCTTEEFIIFIETNYNIDAIFDKDYLKLDQDTGLIKENKKSNKEIVINTWQNSFESVRSAIGKLTESKELKEMIDYHGEFVEYEILDIVNTNLKTFEFLYKSYNALKALNIENINDVLFESGKLNKQKINRRIVLLQVLELINNPKSKYDKKNAHKILKFKDQVCKCKEFKTKDLFRIWKRMRISSMNVTSYNLLDLVMHFKPYKFLRKTNIYKEI